MHKKNNPTQAPMAIFDVLNSKGGKEVFQAPRAVSITEVYGENITCATKLGYTTSPYREGRFFRQMYSCYFPIDANSGIQNDAKTFIDSDLSEIRPFKRRVNEETGSPDAAFSLSEENMKSLLEVLKQLPAGTRPLNCSLQSRQCQFSISKEGVITPLFR